MFPYCSILLLREAEEVEVVELSLSLAMKKLDERFSDLVARTETCLEESGKFSVPFLRKLFGRFPSTRHHQHKEFLDKYICI